MRASRNRFGDVAWVTNSAVSNQWHACAFKRVRHTLNRRDLRHAHACNNARGANWAWADTDFHAIRTMLNQSQRGCTRGDIAADHFDMREVFLHPLHAIQHALRMPVRGIHHDDIHARFS